MASYFVYVLKLSNGDFYTGRTDNLKRRLNERFKGQQKTTRNYLPCELVTYISLNSLDKAINLEKYLKSGSGLAFRKRHLV